MPCTNAKNQVFSDFHLYSVNGLTVSEQPRRDFRSIHIVRIITNAISKFHSRIPLREFQGNSFVGRRRILLLTIGIRSDISTDGKYEFRGFRVSCWYLLKSLKIETPLRHNM